MKKLFTLALSCFFLATTFAQNNVSESFSQVINNPLFVQSAEKTQDHQKVEFSSGSTLRTYRLAVATTGEWARMAAGVDPENPTQSPIQIRNAAYTKVINVIDKLNTIFKTELGIKFQNVNPNLINSSTNIIFDNGNTDPYDNTVSTGQQTRINVIWNTGYSYFIRTNQNAFAVF